MCPLWCFLSIYIIPSSDKQIINFAPTVSAVLATTCISFCRFILRPESYMAQLVLGPGFSPSLLTGKKRMEKEWETWQCVEWRNLSWIITELMAFLQVRIVWMLPGIRLRRSQSSSYEQNNECFNNKGTALCTQSDLNMLFIQEQYFFNFWCKYQGRYVSQIIYLRKSESLDLFHHLYWLRTFCMPG